MKKVADKWHLQAGHCGGSVMWRFILEGGGMAEKEAGLPRGLHNHIEKCLKEGKL